MPKSKRGVLIANVLNLGHSEVVRPVRFHPKALRLIRDQTPEIRMKLGEALRELQLGLSLKMPVSRAMPSVATGTHELRISDSTSSIRVFYWVRFVEAVIVFHAFLKTTQSTPVREIRLARKRLQEVLNEKA